ncbi:MAG TPA: hypothetical protein VFG14_14145 [Chthoniobacteraceae bacterium]|jgi:hypothetical protein|nr:hypothetical protein [Chthoniobacteraceae bacterium]
MKPDENKLEHPTPEQLLKLLDLQIAEQRKRKKSTAAKRAIILTVGMLIILGGLLGALLLFQQMTEDLPRSPKKQPAAQTEQG